MSKVVRKPTAKKPTKSAAHNPHPTPTRTRAAPVGKVLAPPPVAPTSAVPLTRKATLLALLQRPEGALLSELVSVTGWQPQSVRAALTHFRLAGHAVHRQTDAVGVSHYSLPVA